MWSKTTALGTATGSGVVSPLTVPLLAVGAGGDKIITWLGWGQAASWPGAVSRLLGGTDVGMNPVEEKNHPGSIAAPWEGRGWAIYGCGDMWLGLG